MTTTHALTVDVEDWYQVSAFEHLVDRRAWDRWPQRVEVGTRRLLDLFDRRGVKATFFVLGWVAERAPALVAEIAARGHELASHGHEHRLVRSLDAEGFRADLRRAAAAIEAASGVTPRGFRAPSFSMSERETPWAWDVLREEGYRYSSSVFPVRHDRYGSPDFPRQPVRMVGADGRALWEVPMTAWHVLGRAVPAAGGGWLRALPPFVARRALAQAGAAGGPGVVYVHPWELDPDQPVMPGASARSRWRHRVGLRRTEARLEDLLHRFRFAPLTDVLDDLERAPAADGAAAPVRTPPLREVVTP